MARQRKCEFLPWYRRPDYRGKMSEADKRRLDAIRDQEPHPAVTYDQLPEEAKNYISELEVEAYDAKQQSLVGGVALLSVIGALLIDANFTHLVSLTNPLVAATAFPMLVAPWFYYVWKWRRNADAFTPTLEEGMPDPTDERLKTAWELTTSPGGVDRD